MLIVMRFMVSIGVCAGLRVKSNIAATVNNERYSWDYSDVRPQVS